ncbi:MAG: hypothetical protein OXG72_03505 [Acidobacteria bacterium]|nr:hypothetical protein [Acidobacteriota bacterium]
MFTERACPDCGGVRLDAAARAVELAGGWTVGRLVECELTELDRVLEELLARDDYEPIRDVVATLVARMRETLRHLIHLSPKTARLRQRRLHVDEAALPTRTKCCRST